MRTRHYILLAAALASGAGFLLSGCVDAQETLPGATGVGPQVHPAGWTQPGEVTFHGQAVRADGWDMSSCQTCHGRAYNGGTAQKSCLTSGCHATAQGPEDCATCHGGAVNAAPPQDTRNNTAVSERGVGVHQAHLTAMDGKPVKCQECHTVPTAYRSIGHIDSTQFAEVMFSDTLARKTSDNGAIVPNPSYSSSSLTCSSTYCHGTFKNGNPTNAPHWIDPATGTCGTCHGQTGPVVPTSALPKTAAEGGTHPPDSQCQWCHSNINANGAFTNAATHIDGTINLKDLTGNCAACHGSATNDAPPVDLQGNTAVTNRGVGAHQAHLVGSGIALQVQCSECHSIPASVYAAGHLDSDRPAEVVFNGTLARLATSGVTPNPAYNSGSISCGSTYCHGTFKNGNASNAPVWNSAAGTGAVCGTCHGDITKATTKEKALPTGTHPTWTSCQWCHTTINASTTITNAAAHVNGTVDLVSFSLPADCSKCHGSGTNPAPPADLDGNSSVSNKGVGAHQAHLAAVNAKDIACAECHTVPTAVFETGHLDSDRPAEVVFNGALAGLATTGVTPTPAYTSGTATCATTYCHGDFTNGNASNAPVWNSASGTAAQCGSCHGDVTKSTTAEKALPKTSAAGGTHPNYTTCQWCHTAVTAGPTFTNVNDHVDGQVALFQWQSAADCSHCHGSVTNAAPPNDLSGSASSSKVGAHQAHLIASNAKSVACSECHTVPATLDYTGADGHLDGGAGVEVAFQDSIATKSTGGGTVVPSPAYTSNTLSCGSTYCHGDFKNGNTSNAPVWNDPSSAACGTCHGDVSGTTVQEKALPKNSNNGGTHSTSLSCSSCHADVINSDGTFKNAALHMNGELNVFGGARNPWP